MHLLILVWLYFRNVQYSRFLLSLFCLNFAIFSNNLAIHRKHVFGHLNTFLTFLELQFFHFEEDSFYLIKFLRVKNVLATPLGLSRSKCYIPLQLQFPPCPVQSTTVIGNVDRPQSCKAHSGHLGRGSELTFFLQATDQRSVQQNRADYQQIPSDPSSFTCSPTASSQTLTNKQSFNKQ